MNYRQAITTVLLIVGCGIAIFAADLTGKWTTTISTQIGELAYTYTFKADGDKLTGKASSQFGEIEISEGKISGDQISFVENIKYQDMPIRIEYKGKVSGDEIKFTRQVGEFATEAFVATRAK